MSGQFIPSPREYRHLYGLTPARLAKAAPDAVIMHPGPMNRGRIDLGGRPARPQPHHASGGDGRGRAHGRAGSADTKGTRFGGLGMKHAPLTIVNG
jgi:hypothetical protein